MLSRFLPFPRAFILGAAMAAVSCNDGDGPAGPGGLTGRADLGRYAAIGNSLTAG